MYIDSKKFNYKKFDYPNSDELVERDKAFVKEAYIKWVKESADEIVERQWEIDDIGAVEQVGDFIKLLKEAEFAYSIGAFTSAISLVGVCAEDLCKFFAASAGHKLDSQSQYSRVNSLVRLGAITQDTADKFHVIRDLRNDCLHFNQGFKQKDTTSLRADALNSLNLIKGIYAQIMGVVNYQNVDSSKLSEIVNTIAKEAASQELGKLGMDEALTRTRNVFASAFGIDISMNNSGRPVYKTSIYSVEDIDSDGEIIELSLKDLTVDMYIIVDLSERELNEINSLGIKKGDVISTSLMSVPNELEVTGGWRLWSGVKKIRRL